MTDLSEGGAPNARIRRAVEISEDDVRQLRRLLDLFPLHEKEQAIVREPASAPGRSAAESLQGGTAFALARAVLTARQTRKSVFASAIFGEPAWNMLLSLYVHGRGERLTVTRLAQLSDAPLTTAIRWIEYLDQSRLLARRQHPNDARVVLVELTEQAQSKLELYFEKLAGTLAEAQSHS